MSCERLRSRTPSAKRIDTGVLEEHKLEFHKSGKDASAKCNAHHTGDPEHFVIGVLYEIHPDEKPVLDKVEGLGSGYEIKDVIIKLDDGSLIEAFTYYATHIDASLKPFDWYREHVIIGAKENALPDDYIETIQSIEIIEDNDAERRERELSIYL